MVETAERQRARAKRGRGLWFAVGELAQVLWAWVTGEGNLIGLLVAWWQVVSAQVAMGDEE